MILLFTFLLGHIPNGDSEVPVCRGNIVTIVTHGATRDSIGCGHVRSRREESEHQHWLFTRNAPLTFLRAFPRLAELRVCGILHSYQHHGEGDSIRGGSPTIMLTRCSTSYVIMFHT